MSLHEVETLLGPRTFWALFPRWILMLWQPHRYRTNEIFINGIKINFMIEMSSDKTSTLTTRKKERESETTSVASKTQKKKIEMTKAVFMFLFFLSLSRCRLSFFLFFETLWRFLWMLLLDLVLFIVGKWKDHSYIIKVKWTRCPSASLAANHVSAFAVKMLCSQRASQLAIGNWKRVHRPCAASALHTIRLTNVHKESKHLV